MKRALWLILALGSGCATLKPMAVAENSDNDICEYIGNLSYNPRTGYLDPLQTQGPTRIIWYRTPPRLVSDANGGLYECRPHS